MKIKIRKAKISDLKRIADIFRVEYSKSPYNGKWNKSNSLDAIKDHFKKYEIYVLELDKVILGFIIIEKFTSFGEKACFINELVIDSKYQSKGLGKKFILFLEDYCKKREIKKIKLSTNRKAGAFKFYKKLGYKETPSVTMEKNLK